MKIALCTTTIHVPHALKLMRECSQDVMFFVMGDKKSPDSAILDCLKDVPNHLYLDVQHQTALGYACSDLIGFNTLSRRNIAFLEALKWGADIVVAWDTDNYSLNLSYFAHFEAVLKGNWHGIKTTGDESWFDAGQYLRPPAKHRGFPVQRRHLPVYTPVTNIRIGVATSLILNDPDVDATTRLEQAPDAQQVSLLAEAGVVVDPHTWTVFNTQSTAMICELVPAWFLLPGVGRMDDIYASLIVQRVARERDYHVHVGQPFVIQQRHPHDFVKDLRDEIDGYHGVLALADLLDHILLPGRCVLDDTRKIYRTLLNCKFIPRASVEAGLAFLDDCERIL